MIPNTADQFVEWLKTRLVETHTTQRTLAKELDVSFATVSRWVNGTQFPHAAMRDKIAQVLDEREDPALIEATLLARRIVSAPSDVQASIRMLLDIADYVYAETKETEAD